MNILRTTTILLFLMVLALPVSANIDQVTVFSDRAQVTRLMHETSQAGEQVIVFTDIPLNTNLESLRAEGTTSKGGGLKILEIKTKKNYDESITKSLLSDLDDKMQVLQDKLTQYNSEEERLTKQRKVLNIFITNANSGNADDLNTGRFSLQQWKDAYAFYTGEMANVDAAIFTLRKQKKETQEEYRKIQEKLKGYKNRNNLYTLDVHVYYSLKKKSTVDLTLSYVVPSTYWYPTYDTRVDLDSGKTIVEYYARIYQKSGEDWDNVNLILSTARPDLSGSVPVINPWDITYYDYSSDSYSTRTKGGRDKKKMVLKDSFEDSDMDYEKDEGLVESEREEEYQAEIDSQGIALNYGIVKRTTIPSGSEEVKVTISTGITLTPELSWEVVPRLSESVFLKGLVKNTSEFTFLPGEMNLFVGDSFIGVSSIDLINPNQELSLSLGRDPRIKTTYKLDSVERGTRLKKRFEKRRYITTIENNSGKEISIAVLDTVPRSLYPKKIIVKILSISPEQTKIESNSVYTWELKIADGKSATVISEWEVEYPDGVELQGL